MNAYTPAPWQNPNTPRPAFTPSPELEKQITEIQSDYLDVEFCQSVIERLDGITMHLKSTGPDNPRTDAMRAEVLLLELAGDIGQALDETRQKPGPDARPYRPQAAEIAGCVTDLQHIEGLPTVFHQAVNQAIELLGRVCVELEAAPAPLNFNEMMAARARVQGYVTKGESTC